jgi:hypothetical protein
MKLLPDLRPTNLLQRYEFVDNMVKVLASDTDHPNHEEICDLADRLDFFGFGSPMDYDRSDLVLIRQAAQSLANVCHAIIDTYGSRSETLPEVTHSGLYGSRDGMSRKYLSEAVKLIYGFAGLAMSNSATSTYHRLESSAPIAMGAVGVSRECLGLIASIEMQVDAHNRVGRERELIMCLHVGTPPAWATVLVEGALRSQRDRDNAPPPF